MWVTRRDVHVDRIACSWLTRRFIDADAIIRLFGPEEATGISSLITGVAMAYESDEQRTVQGAPVVDGLWSECRRRNATRVSPPSSLLPFGKSRGFAGRLEPHSAWTAPTSWPLSLAARTEFRPPLGHVH
ncbi:chromate resistance protein [Mesorhizobium sp. Ld1326N3]|uniref:Chromate resistance protein n=1 Tax=Mesorhizobium salmacidum TaxID=3015171 RepID=A0ABU8L4R2_9HYPH